MTSMPSSARADGRGADDAVDAGGGAAADENRELVVHVHDVLKSPYLQTLPVQSITARFTCYGHVHGL